MEVLAIRWWSHYGRTDSDGTVMFCSHHRHATHFVPGCHRDRTAAVTIIATETAIEGVFSVVCKGRGERMWTKSKKTCARWDSEVEGKLIDIWADILEELDGKMRKKKEAIANTRLMCTSPRSSADPNSTRKRKSATRLIR